MFMDENGNAKLVQALEQHSRLPATIEEGQVLVSGSIGTLHSRSVLREADAASCHLTAPGIGAGQLLQVER